MQGSTSPAKKGLPSHSPPGHVTRSRTRPTARRASALAGSRPRSRSSHRTCIVEFHPRFHAAPPHRPSAAWRVSSCAPTPSLATLARSAATSSAGASVRSRITCQRIDGSASSSQSTTVTALPPAVGRTGLLAFYHRIGRTLRPPGYPSALTYGSSRCRSPPSPPTPAAFSYVLYDTRHPPGGRGEPVSMARDDAHRDGGIAGVGLGHGDPRPDQDV